MKTPKSNTKINSPSSWSKSRGSDLNVNLDSHFSHIFPSPINAINSEPVDSVFKRVSSPSHQSVTKSIKKLTFEEK